MSLDLIQSIFANSGDVQTPPQNSATGFVNFLNGYTRDYEISLAAGNPQAKAVERQVQNYMFGQMTELAAAWQRAALPPWYASMTSLGGYQKNAIVIRQQPDLSWKPYRSLVAANVSDPLTTPAQWEYIPTAAESLSLVPMPSGAGNAASEVISIAVDFNTLTASGTYEFSSESVYASCSNIPTLDGTSLVGMLEVKAWTGAASSSRIIQRFTSSAGRLFVRYAIGGVWTAWIGWASSDEGRNQKVTWWASSNSGNTYTLTPTPALAGRVEGMRLRFKASASNTGAVTINDGIGAKPLFGLAAAVLTAGCLTLNGNVEIVWNSTWADGSGGFGVWILMSCDSSQIQVPASSYLSASPSQFDNSTKIASMAALRAFGLQPSPILSLSANPTLTAATSAGASVVSTAAGATAWTLPLANTFPAGARIELANFGAGLLTIQRQSTDTINAGGNSSATAFTISTGSFSVVESNGTGSWFVVSGNAIVPTSTQFSNDQQAVNSAFVRSAAAGIVGMTRNVRMVLTAASASATLTADEVVVKTALGGGMGCLPSINKTTNMGTTGEVG